jgi:hypothetical protein
MPAHASPISPSSLHLKPVPVRTARWTGLAERQQMHTKSPRFPNLSLLSGEASQTSPHLLTTLSTSPATPYPPRRSQKPACYRQSLKLFSPPQAGRCPFLSLPSILDYFSFLPLSSALSCKIHYIASKFRVDATIANFNPTISPPFLHHRSLLRRPLFDLQPR